MEATQNLLNEFLEEQESDKELFGFSVDGSTVLTSDKLWYYILKEHLELKFRAAATTFDSFNKTNLPKEVENISLANGLLFKQEKIATQWKDVFLGGANGIIFINDKNKLKTLVDEVSIQHINTAVDPFNKTLQHKQATRLIIKMVVDNCLQLDKTLSTVSEMMQIPQEAKHIIENQKDAAEQSINI